MMTPLDMPTRRPVAPAVRVAYSTSTLQAQQDARLVEARRTFEILRTLQDAETACPGLNGEISTTACARIGCDYCGQGL